MFAVIKTGGKQFRVAANDRITIAKHAGNPGDSISFNSVLMLTDGDKTTLDAKGLGEVSVSAEIVEQTRGEKVIAFKKRRRQNSKRKRGFRAELTVVRITDILTGGARPTAKASAEDAGSEPSPAKPARKPAAGKAGGDKPEAETAAEA